ncbi:hypothetical protein C1H46_009402 [Malus baccata]|uniref:Uncharacterized protein n=1 Tax=Malus baccata TaxID=106549 RepID=A0A540N1K5_MALBA|nr:hypothetical protein C1H46_009402 [Malus baccata]
MNNFSGGTCAEWNAIFLWKLYKLVVFKTNSAQQFYNLVLGNIRTSEAALGGVLIH